VPTFTLQWLERLVQELLAPYEASLDTTRVFVENKGHYSGMSGRWHYTTITSSIGLPASGVSSSTTGIDFR
jgi:hypothetical protein